MRPTIIRTASGVLTLAARVDRRGLRRPRSDC